MVHLYEMGGVIASLRERIEEQLRQADGTARDALAEARFQTDAADLALLFGDTEGAELHLRRARQLAGEVQ